jgi:ketosteroid isomerase-like protein
VEAAAAVDHNRNLIDHFFKALRRGDVPGLRSVFSRDAVWHVPQSGGIDDRHGVDAIVELLTGAPFEFYRPETARFHVEFLVADDQHGALQFRMTCTTARDTAYDNRYVFAYRFADGRIAEGWEHTDTAYWQSTVRGSPELA